MTSPRGSHDESAVLALTSPAATSAETVGAKAANLARAAHAGLPVLAGYAMTTTCPWPATEPVTRQLHDAWTELSNSGQYPLVVRSSSTAEDTSATSMAGQFTSVLDVSSFDTMTAAVDKVRASAGPSEQAQPMAVLLQRQLAPTLGGVMFGVDPVSGDEDRIVVEAVAGGPEALVSGRATAQRYALTRSGRLVSVDGRRITRVHHAPGDALVSRARLHRLAELAQKAADLFGTHQDVEWAFAEDRLWLLQSRPVTAVGAIATAGGPTLGPGPVAETFPDPLRPLEQDLWLDPVGQGMAMAIARVHAAPKATLRSSPVVVCVGGRAAADLDLLGYSGGGKRGWRILDPRPPMRHLAGATQIGRARATMSAETGALLSATDEALARIPALERLSDGELLEIVDSCRDSLTELHTWEMLGALVTQRSTRSLAGVAMSELSAARATGVDEADIISQYPVVLVLTPPRIGPTRQPPPLRTDFRPDQSSGADPGIRELLRLRTRWVQELSARVAYEIGRRLARKGTLSAPGEVAWLRWSRVREQFGDHPGSVDISEAMSGFPGPELPARFRLADDGTVVPAERRGARPAGGTGAGGGRGCGPVAHDGSAAVPAGSVLVVRNLDPALAPALPRLAGLVSESGSTLSHLAILAREQNVPVVVGVHDALTRFAEGQLLLVDGATGQIDQVDADKPAEEGEVES